MKLARGKGRVKSLDSDADGSCSRSSKVGLTDIYNKPSVQVIGEIRIRKTSDVVAGLESKHARYLNKGFIALYMGKGRGASGRGHAKKAAGCGRILFVAQHPLNNVCVHLPWALLSADGLAEEVRQAGRNML